MEQAIGKKYLKVSNLNVAYGLFQDETHIQATLHETLKHLSHLMLGEQSRTTSLQYAWNDGLYLFDLFLAGACGENDPMAWRYLFATYESPLATYLLHLTRDVTFSKDLAAMVLSDMYLPDRSGRMKILSYKGRAPLLGWLKSVAQNKMLNQLNQKDFKHDDLEGTDQFSDRYDLSEHVDANLLLPTFLCCITNCMSELSISERRILDLRFVKGRSLKEIGLTQKVHESTVSRKVDAACRKLKMRVYRRLTLTKGWSRNTVESSIDLILTAFSSIVADKISMLFSEDKGLFE